MRASVRNFSMAKGLLLRWRMEISGGFFAVTSIVWVSISAKYVGSSLTEIVDNFSYRVTALGIVGLTATSSYTFPEISSNNDLPSLRLFTTGVAERPKTFASGFFLLTPVIRPSKFLRL